MDFEGKMVQEDCFVSFEEEPVLDFPDDLLFMFCFLILLCDALIDILFFALVGIS